MFLNFQVSTNNISMNSSATRLTRADPGHPAEDGALRVGENASVFLPPAVRKYRQRDKAEKISKHSTKNI